MPEEKNRLKFKAMKCGLIGQKTCFANPSKKDNCPLYGVHSRR